MAWAGGFSGLGLTRPEFRKWLRSQPKPPYHRIVNHMTDAPYTVASVKGSTRIRNLANYYKNELKWSGGPDLFSLDGEKIYLGTPLGHSIGCKGWNGNSFHIEVEGKYDGKKHDYKTGPGLKNWQVSAWVQAEILEWMGWEPSPDRIKLHKEGKTGHNCPGVVPKDWIIEQIKSAGLKTPGVGAVVGGSAPTAPTTTQRATIKKGSTGGDVPVAQMRLRERGYYTGLVDGDFGPLTDQATRKFQGDHGLVVDGIIGPLTWAKLDKPAISPVEPPTAPEAPPPPPPPEKPLEPPVAPPLPSEQNVNDLHISRAGRELIEHFEGLRLTPYDDVGSLAIGYGHSNRSNKPPVVTPDLRITKEEADEILARDLIEYEDAVKHIVKTPLKQHQFDALVSLAYNWGPGNLKRSELIKIVNTGNHKAAEAEIRRILPDPSKKHYKGILRRRNKEADLYAGK